MTARSPRGALALAFLSAFAATAHEVVWSRLLGRAVGNTAWAVGLALAAFMVGVGAGSLLVRRVASLWRDPRSGYARVEVAIALGALAVDGALLYGPVPSAALGVAGTGLALAVDVLAAGALAVLPALAMGASYPLLVRLVVRDAADAHLLTGLYHRGLWGGLAGVLAAGALLAPGLGLDGTALVACAANLAAAALVARAADPATVTDDTPVHVAGWGGAALDFAAAGALGLGAQVVWNRAVVPYAGVSTFTFAGVVGAYLLAQAAGMALVRRLPPPRRDAASYAALALAPAAALACLALVGTVAPWVPSRDGDAVGWAGAVLACVGAVVGPPAFLLGVAQGGALARLERAAGAWDLAAARVTGVGTMASALGALATTLALMPSAGPRAAVAALGAPALVAAARSRRLGLAVAGGLAAGALAVAAPGPAWFLGPRFDAAPVLHAEHGVQDTTAVVTVDQPVEPAIRRLVANGVSYSGDSLFAQRYMRLLAHLPALRARGARRALVVCVGTGTTAGALLAHGFARVDAVDISPSIRRTLRYFRAVSGGLERDPRARLVVEDGDRFLRRPGERYDVITLEPPPPRAPGASVLYAREFYAAARARLADGGVVAQWLPLHDLNGWEAGAVVRTFVEAFPHATLHLAERNEAVLLGAEDDVAPPPDAQARRLARPAVRASLAEVGFAGRDPWRDTLAADGAALRALTRDAPAIRYAWPAPEYAPFAGPRPPETLDAWLDRLAAAAPAPPEGTSAAALLPAAGPFVRALDRAARPGDREAVVRALSRLFIEEPNDPYRQYMFGFGPYLEARLARLRAAGLPPAAADAVAARIAARRAQGEAIARRATAR